MRLGLFLFLLSFSQFSYGACEVSGKSVKANRDGLIRIFNVIAQCPKNVFELRSELAKRGAEVETFLIANQGFHNPDTRSFFSLFESVSGTIQLGRTSIGVEKGDFLFGHFTAAQGKRLFANQTPRGLMIEIVVYDPKKEYFNFYELIGRNGNAHWFYRGDSRDIVKDLAPLHLQPEPSSPSFSGSIRCAGCHMAGGPILKELKSPHNDWWDKARGDQMLASWQLDTELKKIFRGDGGRLKGLTDAAKLSDYTKKGLAKLSQSQQFQRIVASRSLQEQLRPLFCPVEINFESAPTSNPPETNQNQQILIPSAFFIDERLAQERVAVQRVLYEKALETLGSHFVRGHRDTDHPWLSPVKAHSDFLAVEQLIQRKLVDKKFVSDVLSIDMFNPALSTKRCALLRQVPEKWSEKWQDQFLAQLKASSIPSAQTLARLRETPDSVTQSQRRARNLLTACKKVLQKQSGVNSLLRLLEQRRIEIGANEISKHPRGQILEPGFRVIFPRLRKAGVPGEFRLNDSCELVSSVGHR